MKITDYTKQQVALGLAQRVVEEYAREAEDLGMALEEFIDHIKWPRDYVLARALLNVEHRIIAKDDTMGMFE